MLSSYREVLKKIERLQRKDIEQDNKIMLIFEYIKKFEQAKQQELEQRNRKRIGFKTSDS